MGGKEGVQTFQHLPKRKKGYPISSLKLQMNYLPSEECKLLGAPSLYIANNTSFIYEPLKQVHKKRLLSPCLNLYANGYSRRGGEFFYYIYICIFYANRYHSFSLRYIWGDFTLIAAKRSSWKITQYDRRQIYIMKMHTRKMLH